MNLQNRDLFPSDKNPGPLDVDRVWTICELLCYRFRDRTKSPNAKEHYLAIANEISAIRREWEKWK